MIPVGILIPLLDPVATVTFIVIDHESTTTHIDSIYPLTLGETDYFEILIAQIVVFKTNCYHYVSPMRQL
jgi:hypothetical protein